MLKFYLIRVKCGGIDSTAKCNWIPAANNSHYLRYSTDNDDQERNNDKPARKRQKAAAQDNRAVIAKEVWHYFKPK